MRGNITKIIITLLIVLVLGGVVYFASQSGVIEDQDDLFSLASTDPTADIEARTAEINRTLSEFRGIESIEVDVELFNNPGFLALRATPIEEAVGYAVGRDNPYLLIGIEEDRETDARFQRLLEERIFPWEKDSNPEEVAQQSRAPQTIEISNPVPTVEAPEASETPEDEEGTDTGEASS